MTTSGTALVIHALAASAEADHFDEYAWPGIARLLLARGLDWPALVELAAMDSAPPPAVVETLAGPTAGDPVVPGFWEVVCGLVARTWRLGLCDAVDAMYRMEGLWWLIRDRPRGGDRGLQIIWEGMGLKEIVEFQDVTEEATALLVEADRFVPADAVDGELCAALLEAVC